MLPFFIMKKNLSPKEALRIAYLLHRMAEAERRLINKQLPHKVLMDQRDLDNLKRELEKWNITTLN